MTDLAQPPAPIEPGPAGGGGALGRLVRVFFQPTAVFREILTAPSWIAVLVALVVLGVGAQFVITPRIDMEATVRHSMSSRGGEVSDEQVDRAVEAAEKWQSSPIAKSASAAVVPIVFLIIAGVYFLGVRAMGSETGFKPVFSAVLHASWPASLTATAVTVLVALQRDSFRADEVEGLVKASVAAFMPEGTPATLQAVGSVLSVFNVWQWVLLVIAFQAVARLDKSRSIGVVTVVWLVWTGVKVGLAALRSAF